MSTLLKDIRDVARYTVKDLRCHKPALGSGRNYAWLHRCSSRLGKAADCLDDILQSTEPWSLGAIPESDVDSYCPTGIADAETKIADMLGDLVRIIAKAGEAAALLADARDDLCCQEYLDEVGGTADEAMEMLGRGDGGDS